MEAVHDQHTLKHKRGERRGHTMEVSSFRPRSEECILAVGDSRFYETLSRVRWVESTSRYQEELSEVWLMLMAKWLIMNQVSRMEITVFEDFLLSIRYHAKFHENRPKDWKRPGESLQKVKGKRQTDG